MQTLVAIKTCTVWPSRFAKNGSYSPFKSGFAGWRNVLSPGRFQNSPFSIGPQILLSLNNHDCEVTGGLSSRLVIVGDWRVIVEFLIAKSRLTMISLSNGQPM